MSIDRNLARERAHAAHRSSGYRRARLYGLTNAEYDALLLREDGRCGCCGSTNPDTVIDHCHTTGMVRDLLCRNCNSDVGRFERGQVMRRGHAPRVVLYVFRWRCSSWLSSSVGPS